MAVSTTHTLKRYVGNNSAAPYVIDFQFLDPEDIVVKVTTALGVETTLALGTDYAIAGGLGSTGSVTLVAVFDATNTITIQRQTRQIQPVNLIATGNFPPEAIERQLDRTILLFQETVGGSSGRLLKVDEASSAPLPFSLAGAINRLLGIGSDGETKAFTAAELLILLSLPGEVINRPLALWTDATQRAAKVPNYVGQLGVQTNEKSVWIATSTSAGDWELHPLNDATLGGGSPSAVRGPTQEAVKSFLDAAISDINDNTDAAIDALTGLIGEQGFVETPVGSIQPWAGGAAPMSFLLCDGAEVSRATYADLFAIIGTKWGHGDDSTTFNLPDLRGRFLRGRDGTAGLDPDKLTRTAPAAGGATGNNVGSVQDEALKAHTHGVTDPGHNHQSVIASGITINQGAGTPTPVVNGTTPANTTANTTGIATQSSGGNETRPKNANVDFIIKALPLGIGNPDLQGWSPVFTLQADGERRVLQLFDWIGGTINKPGGIGEYVGSAGMEPLIADGVNIRGEAGANGVVPEAPNDGDYYARKDEGWQSFTPGIGDAPSDGKLYARKDGAWVAILEDAGFASAVNALIATATATFVADAPTDGTPYNRLNNAWAQDMQP